MFTRPHSTKLTYEDYLHFPDDGNRHELIQGDHYMIPAPSTKHQRVSRNLVTALWTFVRQHRLGEVFNAPCDVIFSDEDVVQPDPTCFLSRENRQASSNPTCKALLT